MKTADCLPCPCCGGIAKIEAGKQYQIRIQDWHDIEEECYQPCTVKCEICGLQVTSAACNAAFGGANNAAVRARKLAVEKWNTRVACDSLAVVPSEDALLDVMSKRDHAEETIDRLLDLIGVVYEWSSAYCFGDAIQEAGEVLSARDERIRRECVKLGHDEWFRDLSMVTWSRIERAIMGEAKK